MKKHKAIFAFTLTLLSLAYVSTGFCAESKGFLEKKESGVIDWAKGIVTAWGISTPIKKAASSRCGWWREKFVLPRSNMSFRSRIKYGINSGGNPFETENNHMYTYCSAKLEEFFSLQTVSAITRRYLFQKDIILH